MTKTADKKVVEFISTTPSGIEVLYQTEPKRLYCVRSLSAIGLAVQSGEDPTRAENWIEVPSVTTVLSVLDKPALPWWGMTVGLEGLIALHNMGVVVSVPYGENGQHVLATEKSGSLVVIGKDEAVELLTTHKLTVNHVKAAAGSRGTSVHDALELWADDGTLPDPAMFPPVEQGYVQGLLSFLTHVGAGGAKATASEIMVGSVEHGYAGRYDLRFVIEKPCQVVFHRTPVKGPQWATLEPGEYLADLKTSKDVYPTSHFRQLEAYEQAGIECGYEPTKARGVIKVSADGTYKFVRSTASFEDFRVVLDVYRSNQGLK